mgnify:FL=1|jgi:hypothetical protein|tara:strand:- start:108 stop:380 length:273 start_codon:yes stop_codon:yes gene_type:complete
MIFSLINFFGGFLASSLIDTSLGEFSEWAVVGSSILVATIEGFNTFYFYYKKNSKIFRKNSYMTTVFDMANFFKIGLIYGLVVDAFKLGS